MRLYLGFKCIICSYNRWKYVDTNHTHIYNAENTPLYRYDNNNNSNNFFFKIRFPRRIKAEIHITLLTTITIRSNYTKGGFSLSLLYDILQEIGEIRALYQFILRNRSIDQCYSKLHFHEKISVTR